MSKVTSKHHVNTMSGQIRMEININVQNIGVSHVLEFLMEMKKMQQLVAGGLDFRITCLPSGLSIRRSSGMWIQIVFKPVCMFRYHTAQSFHEKVENI